MGKKGERGAKDKSAAQEEEARIAARRAEHGEEEYVCSGALEVDFPELCARAGLQEAPRVVARPHPPVGAPQEEAEGAVGPAGEQREALSALAQIQAKYAYFRPCVQVELEHDDPKTAREVFIRSECPRPAPRPSPPPPPPRSARLSAARRLEDRGEDAGGPGQESAGPRPPPGPAVSERAGGGAAGLSCSGQPGSVPPLQPLEGRPERPHLRLPAARAGRLRQPQVGAPTPGLGREGGGGRLGMGALLLLLPCRTFVLEGNPLPERSFYKLVSEESSLAHLSLRNNCIDDQAVLLIGQALSSLRSSNKNLVSINLSYNHITDAGATHLANGLRLNRSLLSLSLAHNQIGDEGALKLAEVLGPFALNHTEVVERRRLLLEKEALERGRLPQRHSELKSDRPASHASSTTIDKLQAAKGAKAVKKKEPTKKEEKGPVGGAAPTQPPAAPAAQAKKEDAKQSKKAAPPVDPKAKWAKGVKLGSKDKRSQVPEVEQILEPTEMMNPLLEPAEHREGQVFLQGNRVLIYLNLMRNHISENGLKAFLATVEYQVSRILPGGKGPTGLLRLSLADPAPRSSRPNLPGGAPRTGTGGQSSPLPRRLSPHGCKDGAQPSAH
uniref:Leucine rich repeat containing 71 n=1 Tax=Naja naja TaxID=35670 RepID=A0A8C6Y642_NAJNA